MIVWIVELISVKKNLFFFSYIKFYFSFLVLVHISTLLCVPEARVFYYIFNSSSFFFSPHSMSYHFRRHLDAIQGRHWTSLSQQIRELDTTCHVWTKRFTKIWSWDIWKIFHSRLDDETCLKFIACHHPKSCFSPEPGCMCVSQSE